MIRMLAVWALVLAAAVAPVIAQSKVGASTAWVQAPPAGATSVSAFVVIENPTMYEVYVVSVASPIAGEAVIVRGADGATAVPELAVPAYGQIELKPGEVHIRLKDLKQPLKVGDQVPLTLTTDGGEAIEVSAEVRG